MKMNRTPLKAIKGDAEYETKTVSYNDEEYEITLMELRPGTLLYTASLHGLDHGHNGWFGIKEEDVRQYGTLLEVFKVIGGNNGFVPPPLLILDLSAEFEGNKAFARAIAATNEVESFFDSNWATNRQTYREGDYRVARVLRGTLPNFGILGFGTGRGEAYEDAPMGHHSEICLFPVAYPNIVKVDENEREDFAIQQARVAMAGKRKRKKELQKRRKKKGGKTGKILVFDFSH
jgi:hypothetical protein